MKIESEARQEMEMMQKLQPGTADYKKREDHITMLKAQMEAGRESAQREFTMREAEMMGTIYKEIQRNDGAGGQVARHELRHQGLGPEEADAGCRSQLHDGRDGRNRHLCRSLERHHQRRRQIPQHDV